MSFAVLRAAKRGAGGLGAATTHNLDRLDLPNIDPELTHLNRCLQGSRDILEAVQNRLNATGITPRKNACLAVEFVVSASPEFYQFKKDDNKKQLGLKTLLGNSQPLRDYEQATIDWFNQRYGRENVVAVNRHLDEKTPHLHIFVVPMVTKEVSLTRQRKDRPLKKRRTERKLILSATQVMGGPKDMAAMQTDFAVSVAHLGLSRGIAGTGAKHTTTKQYSALTAAATTGENVEMVQKTLNLLGNRRDRIEQSELRQMKEAMAAQGLVFYKGQFLTQEKAQQAQDIERVARAARQEQRTQNQPTRQATPAQKGGEGKPITATPLSSPVALVQKPAKPKPTPKQDSPRKKGPKLG